MMQRYDLFSIATKIFWSITPFPTNLIINNTPIPKTTTVVFFYHNNTIKDGFVKCMAEEDDLGEIRIEADSDTTFYRIQA